MQHDLAFYFHAATILANIVYSRNIWVTLKVQVGMMTDMIKDLPAYFMAHPSTASRTEDAVFQAIEADNVNHSVPKSNSASAIWFLMCSLNSAQVDNLCRRPLDRQPSKC
ncbi:hypothetical protein DPMN_035187 [Dreissena polymorpha]|uniref:Uncharacterized protein n=1 Tax=Dreissena polymorpha TaxID=45954 RepID=A0A9D4M6U2_DREPO|nr:hypothetical protein DPMN_035187 [Dreissena polymorpha]